MGTCAIFDGFDSVEILKTSLTSLNISIMQSRKEMYLINPKPYADLLK
jgi:hypothetical protein